MSNSEKTCSLRSDYGEMSNSENRDELFKDDWEVFVVRHDKATGKFNWFTECCERIVNRFVNGKKLTSTSCR